MAKNGFTVPYGLSAQAEFIGREDGLEAVVAYLAAIEKYFDDGEKPEGLSTSAEIIFGLARPVLDDCRERSASGKRGAQAKHKLNEAKCKLNEANASYCDKEKEEREEEEEQKAFPPAPLFERQEGEEEKEERETTARVYARESETALSVDVLPEPAFVAETDPKKLTDKAIEEEFDALWLIYPNKKGKTDALRHYKAARKNGTTFDEVEDGIRRYVRHIEDEHTEAHYIAYGSTWFCGHRWEDQYPRGEPRAGSLEWIASL